MIYYKNLEEYLVYKIEYLESLLPPDRIIKTRSKDKIIYVHLHNGKREDHRENTPTGRALAIKHQQIMRQKLEIQDLKNSLRLTQELKKNPPTLKRLKPGLTNCRKLFGPWDELRIKENPYTDRHSYKHNGIDFDSKAEVSIAEIYEAMHIPFIHNGVIDLGDFEFAADFVPLIEETSDYYIHEHYGMEMKGRYLNTAVNKYTKILENNLILGKDVLYTYENTQNFMDKTYAYNCITSTIRNIIGI